MVGAVANRGDPRACGVEAGRCEEAFGKLGGSFRLQFVPPAVFCDGDLALVPPASLTELKQLQAALDVAGIGVVESQSPLAGEHWLGFAAGVVAAARGNRDALAQAPTGPLHFGRHPSARAGGDGKQVDLELYAHRLLRRAEGAIKALCTANVAWSWPDATDAVRWIEQAHAANAAAAMRGLELTSEPWTVERSAASIALHTIRTLQILRVAPHTRRATAHVGIALATRGLIGGIGKPLVDAGTAAFDTLAAGWANPDHATDADAHQLHVLGLLKALHEDSPAHLRAGGPLPLLTVLYAAERHRISADADRRPSWGDLLAVVVEQIGAEIDGRWVAAVVKASGIIPIGASVRLQDGRVGIVAGPGPQSAMRPLVIVGNAYVTPDATVRPIAG